MSVDILVLRAGIQAPDEVSVPRAGFAGLSLDLLRPSSVSCNSYNKTPSILWKCLKTTTQCTWSIRETVTFLDPGFHEMKQEKFDGGMKDRKKDMV